MIQSFNKINIVRGELSFSGDKSISHRALLIASLADGKSRIKNLSESDDVKTTIKCLQALGIEIDSLEEEITVGGKGFKGYQKPLIPLNAGNSGTTARLLAGILSAQNFESLIEGDESLSFRPMNRIIEPLTLMGCNIKCAERTLPIQIYPTANLRTINYELPIASAQVKSALLLAGLHLKNETSVVEFKQTRNHTENLLDLNIKREGGKIISSISKRNYPDPKEYIIPGDISSAIFFVVLALLSDKSELLIKNVSLNPTRTECLNFLKRMGGKIQIDIKGESNREIYGDLHVKSSELSNVKIDPEIIPLIIDEIPILSIAGIFAEGEFEVRGASELRVKESDRINSLLSNFRLLDLVDEEFSDGFKVSGKIKESGVTFNTFGDHRIAMSFAVLASLLEDGGKVDGFESVAISNPSFLDQLRSITS